jgi:hypothetical protein
LYLFVPFIPLPPGSRYFPCIASLTEACQSPIVPLLSHHALVSIAHASIYDTSLIEDNGKEKVKGEE